MGTGIIAGRINGPFINDNLLINPDGTINQRGLDEYIGTGTGRYTYDNWHASGSTSVKSIKNGFELWAESGNATYYTKYLELDYLNDGNYYTFSFFVNEKRIIESFIYNELGTNKYIEIPMDNVSYNAYIHIQTLSDKLLIRIGTDSISVGVKVSFTELKLEPGTIATPYVPPNPSLEKIKCLKYLRVFKNIYPGWYQIWGSTINSATAIRMNLPCEGMIKIPTVSFEGSYPYIVASNTYITDDITINDYDGSTLGIFVKVEGTNTLANMTPILLQDPTKTFTIILSNEIF